MATLFRAVVMLVVLVGLPAAWVYYGPLPPAAMGVIQRTVVTAKNALGWEQASPSNTWPEKTTRTAPRFDASMTEASRTLQQQTADTLVVSPPRPVTRDSQFALASVTVPIAETPAPMQVDPELARQLEPHLSLLRSLDAAEYTLENWGGGGKLYRFRCAIALGASEDLTRQFEAVDADPLRAVHQVVGEVTSWQNARHSGGATRWQ